MISVKMCQHQTSFISTIKDPVGRAARLETADYPQHGPRSPPAAPSLENLMTAVLLSNTPVLASQGSTGSVYTAGRSSIKIGLLQEDVCDTLLRTAEGFSVGYLIFDSE